MSLNGCAEMVCRELVHAGGVAGAPEDWGWFNLVYTGPFARAHVERILRDKVDILHVVIMPLANDPAPIFGFDVIALSGRMTGMFLDLTPTVTAAPWPSVPRIEGSRRPLPDWAHFFSDQMVSCVPTESDVWAGLTVLREYVRGALDPWADGDSVAIAQKQQAYTENQRANPKTYRMLASIVGPEKAHSFIHTVLWPDVITGDEPHGRK